MVRIHPRKTSHGYNETSPGLESSREEKEKKTKKKTWKVEDEAMKAGKS